jgi:2-dehydropantoate 2-reductase
LVIRHRIQRKTTTDYPTVVERVDASQEYDAVFAAMQFQQMQAALGSLAAINTPLLVLVGNNMSPARMEQEILAKSSGQKTVLFGFQSSAGVRTGNDVECVCWGDGKMTLGGLRRVLTSSERDTFATLFSGTKYKLNWEDNMEGWCTSHLAFILPIAYLSYALDYNLKAATRAHRRLLLDAANDGYRMLNCLGIAIRPKGEDAYYRPGPKRVVCSVIVLAIVKTFLGKLCVTDHCRHAATEMEALEAAWDELRLQASDFQMPAWDKLRSSMPDWNDIPRASM